jgi:outer membrane protein TolC
MFILKNCMRVAIPSILLLLHPCSLFSQNHFISLAALTDSADRYLPRIMEKKAQVHAATANVLDTKHQFLPAVRFNDQVNIGSDNSMAGSYFPFSIIPSTSSGVRESPDMQAAAGNVAVVYAEYDLIDFGYKQARVEFARANESFRSADLQRELYVLHSRLCSAYFNLLISESKLAVENQTVDRYSMIFTIIRALTLSGLRPGSDSSLAMAELSKSRITANLLEEQVRNYREEISYLSGLPTDKIFVDLQLISDFEKKRGNQIPYTQTTNPLIDYYEHLKNVYISNERLISSSYLPKIMLTGAYWARGSSIVYNDQYKSMDQGLGFQRFNYLAGVSFQYDLFNSLHKKDKLRSFGFEREAAVLELQQQVLSLASSSRQAQHAIDITEKNLLELPVQMRAASDTYNQKLAQYKAGIISLIDLTNAAFVLDRSLNDYVDAVGHWWQASLSKAIAGGSLPEFVQSIQ